MLPRLIVLTIAVERLVVLIQMCCIFIIQIKYMHAEHTKHLYLMN